MEAQGTTSPAVNGSPGQLGRLLPAAAGTRGTPVVLIQGYFDDYSVDGTRGQPRVRNTKGYLSGMAIRMMCGIKENRRKQLVCPLTDWKKNWGFFPLPHLVSAGIGCALSSQPAFS